VKGESTIAADAHISAVSETLFLPLYALALESQRPDPVMVDPGAVDLTRRLNDHFRTSDKRLFRRLAEGRLPDTLLTSLSLRIRHFDRSVAAFLERHPDGVVVSLGCGLDDRRRRVDNGRVRWFDLDLPEVIELRRQFLPESDRMRFIGMSALDLAWIDLLPDEPGENYMFVAEGLFMYLPPEGVRAIVTALRKRFPGAELIAEVTARRIVEMMGGAWGRGKLRRQFSLSENVVFSFGVDDSHVIERWAPGITLLDEWTSFDEPETQHSWFRWFSGFKLFRWAQWTARYRLGEPVVVADR
jgi:O-methyltransferase involved in polyketide biosynthesis